MIRRTLSVLAAVTLSATALGACSNSSTTDTQSPTSEFNVMAANGVTYEYPKSWQAQPSVSTGAEQGNRAWKQAVGPDATSVAILSQYNLTAEVTAGNLEQFREEVATTLQNLATQSGGATIGPVTPESTAGYPGFTAALTVKDATGQVLNSTVWLFFDGTTEYFLNCQYAPEQQSELIPGCNTIRDTFTVVS